MRVEPNSLGSREIAASRSNPGSVNMVVQRLAARRAVQVENWEEAARAAGALLVELGCATPNYVERMSALVREQGPYMVLAPGLALLHARPEDGGLAPGLAVITLAQPVSFGHPENDPVDLILAFASPNAQDHLDLLARLARALQNGLDLQLRQSESESEMLERLHTALESHVCF